MNPSSLRPITVLVVFTLACELILGFSPALGEDFDPAYDLRIQRLIQQMIRENGLPDSGPPPYSFEWQKHLDEHHPDQPKVHIIWGEADPKRPVGLGFYIDMYMLTGEVDLSGLPSLETLFIGAQDISGLKLNGDSSLATLQAFQNRLWNLDLSQSPRLKNLNVSWNELTELDISGNPALETFEIQENRLSRLDISANLDLLNLDASHNRLTEFRLDSHSRLEKLDLNHNYLSEVDAASLSALTYLDLSRNRLVELEVSASQKLNCLRLDHNPHLKRLKLESKPHLETLSLARTALAELDLAGCQFLTGLNLDRADGPDRLDLGPVSGLNSFSFNYGGPRFLILGPRSGLTALDADESRLERLDLTGAADLEHISLMDGVLAEIVFDRHPRLNRLHLNNNRLTRLDLQSRHDFSALVKLEAPLNALEKLDISGCPALERLDVSANPLKRLDLSLNQKLKYLHLNDTPLENFERGPGGLPDLTFIEARGCRLPLSFLGQMVADREWINIDGHQFNVFFERRALALGEELDLASEAVINGRPTVFQVTGIRDELLEASAYQETKGHFVFKAPGFYRITMSNPVVATKIGSGTQYVEEIITARTGWIEVR